MTGSASSSHLSALSSGPTRRLFRLCLLVVLALTSADASAQRTTNRPARLPEPGRSVAATDDSTALRVNPANLAYLPGAELRWSGIFLDEDLSLPQSGHAVSAAGRVPLVNWAFGARADFVDPPRPLGVVSPENYQWYTFGLATRLGNKSAFGLSVQTSASDGEFANDLTSVSAGYSYRPFNGFALSLVGHDLNAPFNELGLGIGRSYDIAVAVRPTGNRILELGLEGEYLEDEKLWTPRATLGVELGPLGRLRGDFELVDPTSESNRAWQASAALAFYINGMGGSSELSAGVLTGTGLGARNSYNPIASVAARGFREGVGVEPTRYAIKLRLEDTPSQAGHIAFLSKLWDLAEEESVDAVLFELRASPAGSLAAIEELRDAVFQLRRAGKRVICHLEGANGASLFFCSAASKTFINPVGSIRFAGLRSQNLYFARLLSKLGVRAEFVQAGSHKSAPEQYTRSGPSETSQSDQKELLQQFERGIVEGISVGRGLSFAEVRRAIEQGPFTAESAKELKLIDQVAFDDELPKLVKQVTGRETRLLDDKRRRKAPATFGREGALAIVHIDGDITEGRSRTIPLLGGNVTGGYTLADTLKAVRENSQIKAVVLRVDSPGGSAMASEVIWRQVQLTAKAKPTVVSMGSVAASGGYYVAAPAMRIFASPLTVTGSIGVFNGKADISGLLDKLGVDVHVYKTTERADSESMFRSFTDAERQRLQKEVDSFYQVFLNRVAEGRKMKVEDVDKIAQGRVWTGEQALANGLVDELGGLRQAIAYAQKKAGLSTDAPTVVLPRVPRSLISKLLGVPGIHAQGADDTLEQLLPNALQTTLRGLTPLLIHDPEEALARLEFNLEPLK